MGYSPWGHKELYMTKHSTEESQFILQIRPITGISDLESRTKVSPVRYKIGLGFQNSRKRFGRNEEL